jgi:hypothetical protein
VPPVTKTFMQNKLSCQGIFVFGWLGVNCIHV